MFNKWTPDLLGIPQRPVRATRNPNPVYVAEIKVTGPPSVQAFPDRTPWVASESDLMKLNHQINIKQLEPGSREKKLLPEQG